MDSQMQTQSNASAGLPSISMLYQKAKESVMARKEFFYYLAAVPALIQLVGIVLGLLFPPLLILLPILVIASAVLSIYATVGMIKGFEDSTMTDWQAGIKSGKGYFWAIIFTGLLVGIVVAIGSILLIIPGVYLAIATSFYLFTMVLEGKKFWGAAQASMDIVKGNWWGVFGRMLGFGILVGLFVMIISGLGALGGEIVANIASTAASIIVTPISLAFSYHLYKALKMQKGSMPAEQSMDAKEMPSA